MTNDQLVAILKSRSFVETTLPEQSGLRRFEKDGKVFHFYDLTVRPIVYCDKTEDYAKNDFEILLQLHHVEHPVDE